MVEMVVDLYAVDHGYGFCTNANQRVFFRIEDFQRESTGAPLPICGERVGVDSIVTGGRSPRASSLTRLTNPERITGRVKSFDATKGWGFIDHKGDPYFLHRSDLSEPFVPITGSSVTFYAGTRRGKPRACYVLPAAG